MVFSGFYYQNLQSMSTYTHILYQVVFTPKNRHPVLLKENRDLLYRFFGGVFVKRKCILHQVGGIEDHTHFIFFLHPSVALASLIRDLKVASNKFIKEECLFPDFEGWQIGYSAFTYHYEAKNNLINYVKNQETHHKKEPSLLELKRLLKEHNVDYDDKYLSP